MRQSWLLRCSVLSLLALGFILQESAVAQNNVTFNVRMSVKMRELTFVPASDTVWVRGDFNSWGTANPMTLGTDSIARTTVSLPAGAIAYKYFKTLRGGLDWEADPNRTYTVTTGSQTTPLEWFDRDSVYNPPVSDVPVTFQVQMRVKMLEGTFQPASGDSVRVPGSFNGWSTSSPALRDPNSDSIYTGTFNIAQGSTIAYKFFKTARGGLDWEADPNRSYTVPTGGGTVPVTYFDRDSIVNAQVNANIRWQIDMNPMLQLGWFAPTSRDTMEVRGGFNGWSSRRLILQRDPLLTTTYFIIDNFTGSGGDQFYKFFMDLDSAGAVTRFPLWTQDRDGHNYEHPYERGDGNGIYNVNTSGNLTLPIRYYSGINPKGLLLLTTDTVNVTLKVNMGPAKRVAGTPFNGATDTVKLVWIDRLWHSAQVKIQTNFPQIVNAVRQVAGNDSLYQVTFKVIGKAHYGMLYGWRYTKPGGVEVSEGAGLGAQNGYRVRYIAPTAPNTFPRNYTAPQDNWVGPAPLPVEAAPYTTGVREDQTAGVPDAYRLGQNYPNPFNPSTTIKFSIPQSAFVTLRVYNLLGQEVQTLVKEDLQKNNYEVQFNANSLASGIYFYKLEAGKFVETKKMILLK